MLGSQKSLLTFADRLSSAGGSEIAHHLICKELARTGWRVSVGYVEGGDLHEAWQANDMRLSGVPALVPTRSRPIAGGLGAVAAAAWAARQPADLAYVHNPMHVPAAELSGLVKRRRRRIKFPTVVHLHLPPPMRQPEWLNVLLRSVRLVIVPSQSARSAWTERARIAEERLAVIPTGVDLATFRPIDDAQRGRLREGLGLLLEAPVVVFAGRIVHSKGVHVLLEAVRLLGNPVQVLLCGITRDETYWRDLRAAHDGFPLRLCPKGVAVADALAASDVLVLPSIRPETQGLVLAEAMACGTPVLASDVGGLPESLRAFPGHLFPAGNADELAARLRALVSWRVDDPTLGERSHEWVRHNLSIVETTAEISEALMSVIGTSQ